MLMNKNNQIPEHPALCLQQLPSDFPHNLQVQY